ncbi:MAG: DUF1015 domain-containing protein [Deltaproteobacteria bacterium]|nr:DUF1015 domain-containing protein [Deltaproteobacteria bacterium]
MAKIAPFRGFLYQQSRIKDLKSVMAPPYDCISAALQEELYRHNPCNVVRLILGKTFDSDDDYNNRYTRAAAFFQEWRREGVLVRDEQPAVYLYDQKYPNEEGEEMVRKGFLALVRLEDFSSGVVKPHEHTLEGPKTDRFELMKACGANFSPIFSLYSDPTFALESVMRKNRERTPDLSVRYDGDEHHLLWRVTDEGQIRKFQELLNGKPLFIADGHHRYETALRYRDYLRDRTANFTGKEPFNYALMYFCNMEDQGLMVFPIHRLIFGLPALDPAAFLEAAAQNFVVEPDGFDIDDPVSRKRVRATLAGKGKYCFAWYPGGGKIYFLTLRNEAVMNGYFPAEAPKALKTLDVSILHRLVIEELLGISLEDQKNQKNIEYVKGFDEALRGVREGRAQMAFLMNATRVGEVREVANIGGKMPQKSTYFFPKLLSGMVINKITEDP